MLHKCDSIRSVLLFQFLKLMHCVSEKMSVALMFFAKLHMPDSRVLPLNMLACLLPHTLGLTENVPSGALGLVKSHLLWYPISYARNISQEYL